MNDVLERLENWKPNATAIGRSRFAKLLTRIAIDGDTPADKELAELVNLKDSYAPTYEWAGLLDAVRRHRDLADDAAGLADAQAARDEFIPRYSEVLKRRNYERAGGANSTTMRTIRDLAAGLGVPDVLEAAKPQEKTEQHELLAKAEADLAAMKEEKAAINARFDRCQQAVHGREEIERHYWFLFGGFAPSVLEAADRENKALAARTRHISHYLKDTDLQAAAKYPVIYIEHLMRLPEAHGQIERFYFAPMEGQSVDDVADLAEMATKINQSDKPRRYLARRSEQSPIHPEVAKDVTVYLEDLQALVQQGYPMNPDLVWLLMPGQTKAMLAALLAETEKVRKPEVHAVEAPLPRGRAD